MTERGEVEGKRRRENGMWAISLIGLQGTPEPYSALFCADPKSVFCLCRLSSPCSSPQLVLKFLPHTVPLLSHWPVTQRRMKQVLKLNSERFWFSLALLYTKADRLIPETIQGKRIRRSVIKVYVAEPKSQDVQQQP